MIIFFLDAFKERNIYIVNVPAYMTKYYQSIDLMENRYIKRVFEVNSTNGTLIRYYLC